MVLIKPPRQAPLPGTAPLSTFIETTISMARKISPLLVDILVLITVNIRHIHVSSLSTVLRMTVTIIEKRATTALLQAQCQRRLQVNGPSHNVIISKYSTDSDVRSDLNSESPPGQHRPLQDDISFGGGPTQDSDDHEYKNERHDDDFSGKLIKLFDADLRWTLLRLGDGDKPKLPFQVKAKLGTPASPQTEELRNHRDDFDEDDPSKDPRIIIYMDNHDDGMIIRVVDSTHHNNHATKTEMEQNLPWKKDHPFKWFSVWPFRGPRDKYTRMCGN